MVFSLFGKKPSPPPRKPASAKPIAPPPVAKPAPASAAATATTADGGLDRAPAKEELPDLDFTVSGITLTLAREEAERIELREGSARVHPVVEEAAILYANGAAENAVSVIEAALGRGKLELAAEEQMWNLLFDLYQILGRREDFDKHALDYVVRFEKSPPPWSGGDNGCTGLGRGYRPMCNLSGALSAASAKQFEQMQRIVSKNTVVRLDVAKVNSADADGCSQLNEPLGLGQEAETHRHGEQHPCLESCCRTSSRSASGRTSRCGCCCWNYCSSRASRKHSTNGRSIMRLPSRFRRRPGSRR